MCCRRPHALWESGRIDTDAEHTADISTKAAAAALSLAVCTPQSCPCPSSADWPYSCQTVGGDARQPDSTARSRPRGLRDVLVVFKSDGHVAWRVEWSTHCRRLRSVMPKRPGAPTSSGSCPQLACCPAGLEEVS